MKRVPTFIVLLFSVALFTGFGGNRNTKTSNASAWTQCNGFLQGFNVTGIGVCENGNLLAGAALDPPPPYAYIFLSTDSGLTWTLQDTFYVRNYPPYAFYLLTPSVTFITVDTTTLAGVWGGVYWGGIYRSTDDGVTWTKIWENWPEKDSDMTQDINCFCTAKGNIYAGDMRGVYLSTDLGISWIADTTGLYDPDRGKPYTISGLAAVDSNIFASTEGEGIFRSSGGITNWIRVDTTNFDFHSLATIGTKVFAGAFQFYEQDSTGGVFVSTDDGGTWVHSDSGMGTDHSVNVLYSDGSDLFVGTNTSIYASTDTGATWKNISTGTPIGGASAFAVCGSYLFANGTHGIWRYPLSQLTAVKRSPVHIPSEFTLEQNYPNPFNPTTVISYQLPTASHVTLKVYDVLGRELANLVDARQNAGAYNVVFNGSKYASGVYLYRIVAGSIVQTRKMVLIK